MTRRLVVAVALSAATLPAPPAAADGALTFDGTPRLVRTDGHVHDCDSASVVPTATLDGTVADERGRTGRLWGSLWFDGATGGFMAAAGAAAYELHGVTAPLTPAMQALAPSALHVMSYDHWLGAGVTSFGPAVVPPEDAAGLCAYPGSGFAYEGDVELVATLTFSLVPPVA